MTPPNGSPQTVGRRAQVRQMLEAGMTVRQIASALHISTQAVYKHVDALGLNPKKQPSQEASA